MKRLGVLVLLVAICSVAATVKVHAIERSLGAYLVLWHWPPNRHVIAMESMETCLEEAAEHSNTKCLSKLPRLLDASTGVVRSFNNPGF